MLTGNRDPNVLRTLSICVYIKRTSRLFCVALCVHYCDDRPQKKTQCQWTHLKLRKKHKNWPNQQLFYWYFSTSSWTQHIKFSSTHNFRINKFNLFYFLSINIYIVASKLSTLFNDYLEIVLFLWRYFCYPLRPLDVSVVSFLSFCIFIILFWYFSMVRFGELENRHDSRVPYPSPLPPFFANRAPFSLALCQ